MKTRKDPQTMVLIEHAHHGDSEARERLFARVYCRVLADVRRRIGPGLRRDLDSCDLAQDSLAVAARKLDEFEVREPGSFTSWLRAIVQHQILDRVAWQRRDLRDRHRERSARMVAVDDDSQAQFDDVAAATLDPSEDAARRERCEHVQRCLKELDEPYRELIVLRHYEGCDWNRIAHMTGRPSADAARMMYATALAKLGEQIRAHRPPDRLRSES